jgi:tetratricopeptide (TPR) repeat protein
VAIAAGQHSHARTEYAAALDLATETSDKYQQARAHHGLGQARRASGDLDQALGHWQQALALFTGLGTPEAEQVRAEMAAAGHGQHPRS